MHNFRLGALLDISQYCPLLILASALVKQKIEIYGHSN